MQGGASAWLPLVDLLAKLIGFVGALEDRMDKGENEGVMGGFPWLKLEGSARHLARKMREESQKLWACFHWLFVYMCLLAIGS